ncbi:MAG: serine/threonine protein kinase, partial [Myxococcales bacterium]|nr:serine/threonine protein kinase [Myxococcales bacterium]
VAIKVLWPSLAKEGVYVARFLREAKAASRVRHRNVVELLDYGEAAGGLVYSVMELLEGQDLQDLLESQLEGRLGWVQACGLLVQIASGLKAAHGRGVIHRDIKPANCFLTEEDDEPVVKLVDFGVAKLEDDRGQTLTGVAQVVGTPSYIAPEMVRSRAPASPRTDVYALGVLAYQMLTGRVPFKAKTFFELMRQVCFEPVPSLRDQAPGIPPAVEAFVLELLAKDPEHRPPDMATVRARLVALSQETLGPQAVELQGSSRLVVHPIASGPPPIALAEPIVSWEPVSEVAAGSTEVLPRPDEPWHHAGGGW